MTNFKKELEQVINKHSKENGSNTPDFILANFLLLSLQAFDDAVNKRTEWYGTDSAITTSMDWKSLDERAKKEYGFESENQWRATYQGQVLTWLKTQPEFIDDKFHKLTAIADILSRTYFYGDFKIETVNERTIAGLLNDLGLFPCTESDILKRQRYNEYTEQFKNYKL